MHPDLRILVTCCVAIMPAISSAAWQVISAEPGKRVEVDRSSTMDWDVLRARIAEHGMRNSNCVAIAPTATICNIIGVNASIEPCFGNLSVKSNLSGEFTVINGFLVHDLKQLGLWDDVMILDLKHFEGSLRAIDRVPDELKRLATGNRQSVMSFYMLSLAVTHSGDSDSTGALCGNILGALHGEESLPPQLVFEVEGRGTILELADDFVYEFTRGHELHGEYGPYTRWTTRYPGW